MVEPVRARAAVVDQMTQRASLVQTNGLSVQVRRNRVNSSPMKMMGDVPGVLEPPPPNVVQAVGAKIQPLNAGPNAARAAQAVGGNIDIQA